MTTRRLRSQRLLVDLRAWEDYAASWARAARVAGYADEAMLRALRRGDRATALWWAALSQRLDTLIAALREAEESERRFDARMRQGAA